MSAIIDPAKLKVVELRAELSARGLETKGNKPVLVQRLREAIEAESGKDLPDTSIADTSTEELNASSISQKSPTTRRRRKVSEREPSPEPAPPKSPPEDETPDEQSDAVVLEEDTPSESSADVKVEDKNMEDSIDEEKEIVIKSPTDDQHESSDEAPDEVTKEDGEKIKNESKEEDEEDGDEVEESKDVDMVEEKKDEDVTQESKDIDMVEAPTVESSKNQDDTTSEKESAEPRNRKSRWGSVAEKDFTDQSDFGNNCDIPGVGISDEANVRGEKRRHASPSPERSSRRRSRSPPREDEPDIDADRVQLSWIDSDLNLQVNKENFTVAEPMHNEGFGYMWAGARSTHGFNNGKVWYEVKLLENCDWKEAPKLETKERKHDKHKAETKDKKHDKNKSEITEDEKDTNKTESKPTETDEHSTESKEKENDDIKDEDNDAVISEITEKENDAIKSVTKGDENEAINSEIKDEENSKISEIKEDEDIVDGDEVLTDSKEQKSDEIKTDSDDTEIKIATDEEVKSETEDTDKNKIEIQEDEYKMETNESKTEALTKENEAESKESETKIEDTPEPEDEQKNTSVTLELHHIFRIGWSLAGTNLQLGEQPHSYAYDSEGFAVNDSKFTEYGVKYSVGDVIGAFLNFDTEDLTMTYTVNGELRPVAFTVPRSELPENAVLFPHVLTRNLKFEVNYGDNDEPWFQPPAELDEYIFVKNVEDKIVGISRPDKREDCEVVMMVGLPCSGKTQWVNNHVKDNPDKRFNVLGVSYILDKMKFQGKPRKEHFNASATVLLDKCTRCLNKLIDLASSRRRNFILDQTNLFSSAQRRKMRPFDGFRRHAVVIVVTDDEQTTREKSRQQADGKDVPDSAVLEMKANMSLPSTCDWLDEVTFAELDETKANETVQKYNKQGREAGYGPNYTNKYNNQRQKGNGDRRGSTGSGGQWNRNNRRDSRDRSSNRWSGSSGGGGGGGAHSHQRQNNWGGNNRGSGNYGRNDRPSHHGGSGGGGYNNRNNPNNRMMPARGGGGGFNRHQGDGGYNRNRNQPPHRNQPNKGGNWSGNGSGGHGQWSNQGNWSNQGGWGHQAAAQGAGPGWAQGSWGQFGQGQGQSGQQWKGNYGAQAQQFQQQGYPQGYVAGQYGSQPYANWNYYGQYAQNWNPQAQSGVTADTANAAQYNQYSQQQAAWAQYAQSGGYGAYGQTPAAQGTNAVTGSASSTQPATK